MRAASSNSEPICVRLHPFAHLLQQFEILALEQHLSGMQMTAIFVTVDRQTAGSQASLDLVLDAWTRAILEHCVGTCPQRKNLADYVDSLAQAVGRAERT